MAAVLPDLSHLTLADEEKVYVPSDDTFLLCDAILKDQEFLLKEAKPLFVVEIGCGSGCVITYVTKLLLDNNFNSFLPMGIDINIDALHLTRRTFERNINSRQQNIQLVQSNLFQAFENTSFQNSVDILIFNPPYVPSESSEIGKI
jgi:release factor glutamine methyltransferase